MFVSLTESLRIWLIKVGISSSNASVMAGITDFLIIMVISIALYYITKYIIIRVLKRIASKTSSIWDDVLIEKKVFNRLAFLIPGILIYQSVPAALDEFSPALTTLALKLTNIYIIIIFLMVINSFFNAIYEVYQKSEYAVHHPIKGYIQVGKIVMFIIGSLLILSYLFNQSPIYMLGGLGAFSAVLLLIFKDPILGFVGGIQLSANDMVRQGDWINMPKFGADGTVMEISLTTVKVQNFDNTITTLPTYALVSESFQNYRGMKESGVRRIKRSISIDMSSVRFCTDEMLEKFRKISLLHNYINETQAQLEKYNKENSIDNSVSVNGRRQTNIGVFRAYLEKYLTQHPLIHNESDQLVRQLQPHSTGIPIEIYAFIQETEFIKFENVQSDIFDHILAIVPEFDLRVFQSPTGEDLRQSQVAYWERNESGPTV
ncbi:MAG: mechanosensitive ion channel [Bacteroidales bacterium]|nr:mechanosensitive ion channel [Bacteroidales bacterium]